MEDVKYRYTFWKFLCLCSLTKVCDSASYSHLGCYYDKEEPGLRDINGLDITKSEIDLHECLETCRGRGYPYAGLQAITTGGFKCYCGDTYGSWGKASSAHRSCNYTCGTSQKVSCGGILANDVYYTVRVDSGYTSALKKVFHSDEKTYVEARRQCVTNGGDLATLETSTLVNESASLAEQGGQTSGHVWFGLRKRFLNSSLNYEWVQPQVQPFDINAFQNSFHQNSIQNPCVSLLPELRLWKSTACPIPYPYVCKQISPDLLETSPAPTGGSDSGGDEEDDGPNLLSLYIVMPIFALCYGGSCIAYCTYKAYKSCKRRKREQMLLTNIESISGHEYEPETKPKAQQRPLSSGRGRVYPAPTPGQIQPKVGYHQPPPAKVPPHKQQPQPPPRLAQTPREPRPASSEGVELQLQQTPRPKQVGPPPPVKSPIDDRPKSRADKKREKLLENALKEARERRARDGNSVTPTGNRSRPSPPITPPNKGEDPSDSGDSTTNLLKDGKESPARTASGQSQDPTQMSISDILKMKVAVNNNRKRAKKIIQA